MGADAGHRRAPDAYLLTVEVPGVKPEDLDITLEGGVLAVRGERRFQDQSADQHRVERRYRAFRRSTPLPSQAQAERPAPERSTAARQPANHPRRTTRRFNLGRRAAPAGGPSGDRPRLAAATYRRLEQERVSRS